jgi:drug/metabolite transporter (DMT)-like permease
VLPALLFMARTRALAKGAGWIALRCLGLIGICFCMYPALPFIDMVLAGAAFYTAPLFIIGLSAVVLGNAFLALRATV